MNLITLEILQKLLELEIKLGGYEIEKFKKEFDNNPGIALDWSYHLFERVALKQEAEYLLDIIRKNKKITIEKIKGYLEEDVLNGARFPSHSTSITANLWVESKLVAKAHILSKIMRGY